MRDVDEPSNSQHGDTYVVTISFQHSHPDVVALGGINVKYKAAVY
jgi:hypothetical protein